MSTLYDLVVGNKDCSYHRLTKCIQDSLSSMVLYEWKDLSNALEIDILQRQELDIDFSQRRKRITEVLEELLIRWRSNEGSRATLGEIIYRLERIKWINTKEFIEREFQSYNSPQNLTKISEAEQTGNAQDTVDVPIQARLPLHLPKLVKSFPSHLSWIEEKWITANIQKSASRIQSLTTMKDYVASFLGPVKIDDEEFPYEDESAEGGLNSDGSPFLQFCSIKLCRAARLAYIGKTECAEKQLMDIKIRKDVPVEYAEIVKLSVESLECSIKLQGNPNQITYQPIISKLKNSWEKQVTTGRHSAFIAFLRADLGNALKINPQVVLKLRERSVNLDPDYFLWHGALYYYLRSSRKEKKLTQPTEKETEACNRQWELTKEDKLGRQWAMRDRAILLKDILSDKDKAYWNSHSSEYLECLTLLRNTLRVAREFKSKEITKAVFSLADFLINGKGDKLNPQEGLDLLVEFSEGNEVKFKSALFYKLGQLYQKGHENLRLRPNWKTSVVYYQKSLEETPWQIGSIKGYIYMTKKLRSDGWQSSILKVAENAFTSLRKDVILEELNKYLIKQACLFWCEAASDEERLLSYKLWLTILKYSSSIGKLLCDNIKDFTFDSSAMQRQKSTRDLAMVGIKKIEKSNSMNPFESMLIDMLTSYKVDHE